MKRVNEFMGFLNNVFSDVPYAEIFERRPADYNSEYSYSICKIDNINKMQSVEYLAGVLKALAESKLKFTAEYYTNYGAFIRMSVKIESRKISIFIDTQLVED
jgi:hypothetical protein